MMNTQFGMMMSNDYKPDFINVFATLFFAIFIKLF